ncbi:hypothetical protein SNE40_015173 [Patella caerulea]
MFVLDLLLVIGVGSENGQGNSWCKVCDHVSSDNIASKPSHFTPFFKYYSETDIPDVKQDSIPISRTSIPLLTSKQIGPSNTKLVRKMRDVNVINVNLNNKSWNERSSKTVFGYRPEKRHGININVKATNYILEVNDKDMRFNRQTSSLSKRNMDIDSQETSNSQVGTTSQQAIDNDTKLLEEAFKAKDISIPSAKTSQYIKMDRDKQNIAMDLLVGHKYDLGVGTQIPSLYEEPQPGLASFDVHNIFRRGLQSKNVKQLMFEVNQDTRSEGTELPKRKPRSSGGDQVTSTPHLSEIMNFSTTNPTILSDPELKKQTVQRQNQTNSSQTSHGIVSIDEYNQSSIILGYVMYVVLVLTLVFNIFNIIVYCKPIMRCAVGTYLVAISISDVITALLELSLQIISDIYGVNATTSQVYLTYGIFVSNFVTSSFRRAIYTLTALISFERLMAVARPISGRFMRVAKNPLIVISATIVVLLGCHSYVLFRFNIVQLYSNDSNRSVYGISPSVYQKSSGVAFNILSMVCKVLFVYLPLLAISIFNVVTLCYMRYHRAVRKQLQTRSSVRPNTTAPAEIQTTLAIVVSTTLFVILALPTSTSSFVSQIFTEFSINGRERYMYLLLTRIGAICEITGTALDFIVYLIICKKYRATLFNLFKCRHREHSDALRELSCSSSSTVISNRRTFYSLETLHASVPVT